MKNTINKTHVPKLHINYKIVSWLNNELPDVTVTITSGKSTCHFIGSYDGDHALTSKLLSHMVNDVSLKDSEKGVKKREGKCYNRHEQSCNGRLPNEERSRKNESAV